MARRYGRLPSEIIGEENGFVALTINLHAMLSGLEEEAVAREQAEFERKHRRR